GFSSYLDEAPMEIDAAVRITLPHALEASLGGGAGVLRGVGSPLARAFFGISWAPDYRDRDGDGIPDMDDQCPDQPEDRDGYKDEDGCPDPDNDGDGIPDEHDKCPNEPEDIDNFQDDDGCPDPDNDHDGIPEQLDKCPNEPETINGIKDDDGCPDDGPLHVTLVGEEIKVDQAIAFTRAKLKETAWLLDQLALVLKG